MRERLLDAIAGRLGLDRVRCAGVSIAAHAYVLLLDTLGTEIVLDSGDYAGLPHKALAAVELGRGSAKNSLNAAPAANSSAPASPCSVEKVGALDEVRISVDEQGTVEAVSGLRVGRPGHGDRADLRHVRRRLS